jgi:AraC family transcriptional regulator
MAITSRILACGQGWQVSDVVCTAGPGDRAYEERHSFMCIAVVTGGTFEYRASQGAGFMSPGSLLLGNVGTCFECGHAHGTGDRCLSFQFSPDFHERIVSSLGGIRRLPFPTASLPPLEALMPMISEAHALREHPGEEWEYLELTLRLAGAVCDSFPSSAKSQRAPTLRDERRVARAIRRIEASPREKLSLAELAEEAAASPYHFLRVFEQVVGITPGQYILRDRLRRAAVRLRTTNESVSSIAMETGFGDLSTFNRHFRRFLGAKPSEFRARSDRGGAEGATSQASARS